MQPIRSPLRRNLHHRRVVLTTPPPPPPPPPQGRLPRGRADGVEGVRVVGGAVGDDVGSGAALVGQPLEQRSGVVLRKGVCTFRGCVRYQRRRSRGVRQGRQDLSRTLHARVADGARAGVRGGSVRCDRAGFARAPRGSRELWRQDRLFGPRARNARILRGEPRRAGQRRGSGVDVEAHSRRNERVARFGDNRRCARQDGRAAWVPDLVRILASDRRGQREARRVRRFARVGVRRHHHEMGQAAP